MHDFDYDAMQKKRIARSAAHMKRGSKSKRCSLPSDYMTQAEWKRRNGPVATYKLDAPMNWNTFKGMPDDLRKTYLTNLRELYGATDEMLGRMFFIDKSAVYNHRMKLGVTGSVTRLTGKSKDIREAKWSAFLNGVVGGNENSSEDIAEEPVMEELIIEEPVIEEPVVEETKPALKDWPKEFVIPKFVYEENIKPLSLDELTAVFTGVFNPTSFLQWLAQLPIPEDSVRIKVEVTRK